MKWQEHLHVAKSLQNEPNIVWTVVLAILGRWDMYSYEIMAPLISLPKSIPNTYLLPLHAR